MENNILYTKKFILRVIFALIQAIVSFMIIPSCSIYHFDITTCVDKRNILQNLLFYHKLPKIIKHTPLLKLWYIPTIRKSNKIKPYSKIIFYFIRYDKFKYIQNIFLMQINIYYYNHACNFFCDFNLQSACS